LIANSSSVIMAPYPLPTGRYFISNKAFDNFAGHWLEGGDATTKLPIIGTRDRFVVSLMLSVSRLLLSERQLLAVGRYARQRRFVRSHSQRVYRRGRRE